jgi:hypothetical protein
MAMSLSTCARCYHIIKAINWYIGRIKLLTRAASRGRAQRRPPRSAPPLFPLGVTLRALSVLRVFCDDPPTLSVDEV